MRGLTQRSRAESLLAGNKKKPSTKETAAETESSRPSSEHKPWGVTNAWSVRVVMHSSLQSPHAENTGEVWAEQSRVLFLAASPFGEKGRECTWGEPASVSWLGDDSREAWGQSSQLLERRGWWEDCHHSCVTFHHHSSKACQGGHANPVLKISTISLLLVLFFTLMEKFCKHRYKVKRMDHEQVGWTLVHMLSPMFHPSTVYALTPMLTRRLFFFFFFLDHVKMIHRCLFLTLQPLILLHTPPKNEDFFLPNHNKINTPKNTDNNSLMPQSPVHTQISLPCPNFYSWFLRTVTQSRLMHCL